jgi:uncharacterized protein (DUF2235 family)
MDAYTWLSDHYRPGDKIFLFGKFFGHFIYFTALKARPGFSRGAYQVRALAGMIDQVSTSFDL